MNLAEIRQRLETLMESPFERPFVCDGNPLDCRVMVIGINPATRMNSSFWRWWTDTDGFLFDDWLEVYRKERVSAGKSEDSSTRRRVSRLSKAIEAYGYKCLETNLYPSPTARATDLAPDQRQTTIIEYLVQCIYPQVILLHGKETWNWVPPKSIGAKIIKVAHLSRVSYARVEEIANSILSVLNGSSNMPEGCDPQTGSDYHHHPEIWDVESEEAWLQAMKERRRAAGIESVLASCIRYCDAKGTAKNERTDGGLTYSCIRTHGLRAVTIRPTSHRIDIYNLENVPPQYSSHVHDRTRRHLRMPLSLWGEDLQRLIDEAFDR